MEKGYPFTIRGWRLLHLSLEAVLADPITLQAQYPGMVSATSAEPGSQVVQVIAASPSRPCRCAGLRLALRPGEIFCPLLHCQQRARQALQRLPIRPAQALAKGMGLPHRGLRQPAGAVLLRLKGGTSGMAAVTPPPWRWAEKSRRVAPEPVEGELALAISHFRLFSAKTPSRGRGRLGFHRALMRDFPFVP